MKKTQKEKKTPRSPILPPETLEIAGRREILLDGVLGIAAYSTENVCIRTKCGFDGAKIGKNNIICNFFKKTLAYIKKKLYLCT